MLATRPATCRTDAYEIDNKGRPEREVKGGKTGWEEAA